MRYKKDQYNEEWFAHKVTHTICIYEYTQRDPLFIIVELPNRNFLPIH